MAEQNNASRIWMTIALLATAAALFFALRGPAEPTAAPAPAPEPAKPAQEAVPAPAPVSPTALPAAASPAWPKAPEVGDEPAQQPSVTNLVEDPEQARELTAKALRESGGEEAYAAFLSATYKLSTTETGALTNGTLLHGETGVVVRTFDELGARLGGDSKRCWFDRGAGVVLGCDPLSQSLLVLDRVVHHVALRLPLTRAPYKLVKTGVFERDGVHTNHYAYEIEGTQWHATVLEDPTTLRPLSVELWTRDEEMWGRDRRGNALVCELSAWRKFGNVPFPTVRRYLVQEGAPKPGPEGARGPDKPGSGAPAGLAGAPGSGPTDPASVAAGSPGAPGDPGATEGDNQAVPRQKEKTRPLHNVIITEVVPGVGGANLQAPAPTAPGPLVVGPRPTLVGVQMPLPEQSQLNPMMRKVGELLINQVRPLYIDAYQQLGAGDDAASLRQQMAVLAVPMAAVGLAGRPEATTITGAAKVARKVVRFSPAELPTRYAGFLQEVRAAGHKPLEGAPHLVHVLIVPMTSESETGDIDLSVPWLLEFQVTLQP